MFACRFLRIRNKDSFLVFAGTILVFRVSVLYVTCQILWPFLLPLARGNKQAQAADEMPEAAPISVDRDNLQGPLLLLGQPLLLFTQARYQGMETSGYVLV